jgi:hypothetical protein
MQLISWNVFVVIRKAVSPPIVLNGLPKRVDRQPGTVLVVRGKATEDSVDVFGLKLQGIIKGSSFDQIAHDTGTYYGIDAALGKISDILNDAVFDPKLYRQCVPATADTHGKAVCRFQFSHIPGGLSMGQKGPADSLRLGFFSPLFG